MSKMKVLLHLKLHTTLFTNVMLRFQKAGCEAGKQSQ